MDGKLCIVANTHMWYIYMCVPYILNPESAPKILWTQLKKVNGRLGKPAFDTLDSSVM